MSDVTPSQAAPAAATPVEMISAMLDAERVTPEPQQPETPETPEPEHVPENNAQVEGDERPPEEKEAVAEIPLEQVEAIELEVKYKGDDGKDVVEKKPIKELRDGYMRQQDYSRKTAELARQREGVEAEKRQAIESEVTGQRETLKQLRSLVIESVAPELKNADWNALAKNDPFEYVRLQNQANQLQNTLAQIAARDKELADKQTAEQSQVLKKKAQATWQTLEADIPGFNKELYQSLLKTGIEAGVDAEKVSNWVDAGEIKLLHQAYLYNQLKVGKPAESKKVAVPPPAIKPGAANSVPQKVQRQGKALDQLRKTGNVNDLANFLSASMK